MNPEKIPCYYFCTDEAGNITEVNERACVQLGYERDELLGNKVTIIFTVATRIFHQTHFFPLIRMQGTADEIFITLLTKANQQIPMLINAERTDENGTIIIQYVGIPIYNRKKFEDGLVAAKKTAEAALQENTTLKQLKLELQAHSEQLDQSISKVHRQNEELKQLNWIVTHDLQEPLRKLSIFSDILLSKNKTGVDFDNILSRLMATSSQMRFILSAVQQYVWLTDVKSNFTLIDLTSVLLTVEKKLADEFPQTTLEIQLKNSLPFNADAKQIELLLYQVLLNALQFRKDGERAFVQIDSTVIKKNSFTKVKEKYSYQNFLRLRITDHGKGFDPAYKDQVFELFKRLHTGNSRGLGLSLCKKVVENHDGRISIDTKIGEGTTVTVLLPMVSVQL